jgi:UDP-N-acetylmuramate--alanine ligase
VTSAAPVPVQRATPEPRASIFPGGAPPLAPRMTPSDVPRRTADPVRAGAPSRPGTCSADDRGSTRPPRGLRLALVGGGTGGHVTPGLHFLQQARADGWLASVLWLRGDRRADQNLLEDLDQRLAPVPVHCRSLGLEGGRDAAPSRTAQLRRLPRAVLRARHALRDEGVELLLGLGGYLSIPAVLAARSLRLPVVLVEVNAVAGGATRLLEPWVARVCHAYSASLPTGAPDLDRHLVTGPPVAQGFGARSAATVTAAAELLRSAGLEPDRPLLLVLGGSQGARPINAFVAEHLPVLLRDGVQVLHQVGPGRLAEAAPPTPGYAAVEFLEPMEPALAAATLVLSRAGASTLAELAAAGIPTVLVPFPQAAARHQEVNAAQVADGAVVIPQAKLDAERAAGINRLAGREGRARRESMSAELRRRVPGDGARRLLEACLQVLGRDPREGPPRSTHPGHPAPAAQTLSIALPRRIHLLGAGGAGVSGLARLLLARGHKLSGHDRSSGPLLEGLAPLGVALTTGPSSGEQLPGPTELVIRSAAVPVDDPQVRAARERGVPVLKYAEALGRLAPAGRTLAVAGTHGKTSTAWLLLHALRSALADAADEDRPGALIGGTCRTLATNALPPGRDGWFVVEACEFDRSFLQLAPHAALITNVDADHLDCFGSLDGVVEAFAQFAERVAPSGVLVLGADVPPAVERAARARVLRLGRDFELVPRGVTAGCHRFELRGLGRDPLPVELAVPGAFQCGNGALALALGSALLGAERAPRLAAGLGQYRGAGRRFESWGSCEGVELVHDYAHHPTEVRATLAAAAEVFPGQPLHVLFQPHQQERTARLLEEFAQSFGAATTVVVAEVYGARRPGTDQPAADAGTLVDRLRFRGVEAERGGTLAQSTERFLGHLRGPCAALVLGAGDVDTVRDDLLRSLSLRSGAQGRPGR